MRNGKQTENVLLPLSNLLHQLSNLRAEEPKSCSRRNPVMTRQGRLGEEYIFRPIGKERIRLDFFGLSNTYPNWRFWSTGIKSLKIRYKIIGTAKKCNKKCKHCSREQDQKKQIFEKTLIQKFHETVSLKKVPGTQG